MTSLVLLALSPETIETLERGLAGRLGADDATVRLIDGALSTEIAAARARHGPVPIGVAARTATEAIDAIEHGADEAMVIPTGSIVAAHELVDRTRVRGRLRAAEAQAKVNIAHADKLTALGTLVAGVAHEVNHPLSALLLNLALLPEHVKAAGSVLDELRAAVLAGRALGRDDVVRIAALGGSFQTQVVMEQVDELQQIARLMQSIVKDLFVFARADDADPAEPTDLAELIEVVLRFSGRNLTQVATVERDYGVGLPRVLAPRGRLTQVLANIVVNATHAMREVQRDVHRLRISLRADDEAVAISVSDSGPGIPPEAVDRIFDPFFTTKRMSMGTGLGLSISRNLMRKMGGDLLVESVFGEGATFIVVVPRATEVEMGLAEVQARLAPRTQLASQRPAVMVVDDHEQLVRAYSRVLGRHFDLLVASDSQEAIEMLSSGSKADVVLADLGPAPNDGAQLFRWLEGHLPKLAERTVFVSAEPNLPRNRQILSSRTNIVLPKPTSADALISAIESAARR